MSIKLKAFMVIMLVVFAATAASLFTGLFFTNRSLAETLEHDLSFAIEIADGLVSTKMQLLKSNAATMAERLLRAGSDKELTNIMKTHVDACPDCISQSVFTRNGLIASYGMRISSDEILAHSKQIEMAYNGMTTISSPFYCAGTNDFIMNIYTPLDHNRILSLTMPGLMFADLISGYKLWSTGNIYIVNEEGTIIADIESDLVLNQRNYIKSVEANPDLASEEERGISNFLHKMLSNEKGVGIYSYKGIERLCSYRCITGTLLGWRVAVVAPLNESPKANVQQGLLFTALIFLIMGTIVSVFLSGFIVRPFKELEKLNETVRAQNERTRILLDEMPFACRIWNKDFKIFDCNNESLRLFNLKDKQNFIDNYFGFYPEYQPDGGLSKEKAVEYIKKAFEEGRYVFNWMYQMPDGALIPTENTFVRIPHEDDYAVAGYTRDLREHEKMMGEINQRDKLLSTANRTAEILLTTEDGTDIGTSLVKSMEIVGRTVDADRVLIWRNEMIDGELCFVLAYEWLSDIGREKTPLFIGSKIPYRDTPGWENIFLNRHHINGPVSKMSQENQMLLEIYDMKTIVLLPLFLQDNFWGLFTIDDCLQERTFAEDEINILHSVSLLMANAVNRSAQAEKIREAHKRTKVLLDATPFGANLWNRDCRLFDCNEESVKLFGLKSKEEYLERFFDLSPKYQPDGQNSYEKAVAFIAKAFEEGKCVLEWMHQTLDGDFIPTEATLVRVPYEDGFAVAGYTRDLREHNKMIQEIEQRDNLLNTVNRAATILLQSGIDNFAKDLHRCMGMIAEAVNVDRISIWKNYTQDERLYYSQIFEYVRGVEPSNDKNNMPETWRSVKEPRCYAEKVPSWEEILSKGDCINSLVRDMPPVEQAHLSPQGLLSIFASPVFIQDQFWGFVGYDNYQHEWVFTENEQAIMNSGSIAIANAFRQNDSAEQLKDALEKSQKASSAKSDFLANMSHEMRTPLNAVIGLSGLSLENDRLGEETHTNLEKIYDAGSTLLSIVNDILDISKIEAGKFEFVEAEYDVPSLINDTITQNALRIGEKPIELELNIDKNMFSRLHGDELRVKQIMSNLLSNAIKYTQEGAVELSVHCAREGDTVWLTIKVRDTGRGIRPEDIDKLFYDYTQLDLESNRKIEGTGLGLPITKRLAEMMDGSINIESNYGIGSVFTVRIRQKFVTETTILPEIAENLKNFKYFDGRREKKIRFKRVSLPYARILLVDDNLTNLDVAKGLMKPYGMQIDCVDSGEKAIDAIHAEKVKYNAVFMDHMMPGMDGIEATRVIRDIDTDYAKNIPIIALTANAIAGNEEMFLSRGFQAFLSKPIDISRLDEVIRNWVRDKELEKTLTDRHIFVDGQLLPDLKNGQDRREIADRRGGIDRRKSSMKFAGLDINKGIERFGDDEETYLQVLHSYAVNTRPLLESIEHINEDELADYATTVHGIKGSSRGIFADMVGDSAENLERAAKAGDFNYVKKHNPTFLDTVWKFIYDLEDMLSDKSTENPKPKKDKPDNKTLSKLLVACKTYNMDGADTAMTEIKSYQYESDNGLVDWLSENVKLVNFKQIIEKLSALTK